MNHHCQVHFCQYDEDFEIASAKEATGDGTVVIYSLIDPFTHEHRYVGQSIRPLERLTNHCNDRSKTWRTNWIQGLLAKGQRPKIFVLDVVPAGEDWRPVERYWIATIRAIGYPLTNCTDGGDGVPNLPPEIRERIRQASVGRKPTPEQLAKLRQRRTWKHTQEHREYMRRIMTGRAFTPQWREKISKGTAKFTEDEAYEIISLRLYGWRARDIAEAYGIHRTGIRNLMTGRHRCYRSAFERAMREQVKESGELFTAKEGEVA